MCCRISSSRPVRRGVCSAIAPSNTSSPSPTLRTSADISDAEESLAMKPEAPAARATLGEIPPAPEISTTRGAGASVRSRAHSSAPDSPPSSRSTSATWGSKRRQSASASLLVRAARQRSTHSSWPSISRNPQCTTSWSSTTRTRNGFCATESGAALLTEELIPASAPRGAPATFRALFRRTRERRRAGAPRAWPNVDRPLPSRSSGAGRRRCCARRG